MDDNYNPLVDPPPPEVPLPNAPLASVLAQVRFPLILSIEDAARVAPFQERVRKDYPIANEQNSERIIVLPGTEPRFERTRSWTFSSKDGAWTVALARDFVALQAARYSSRADFMGRLEHVLLALQEAFQPATVERIGVRYVDRIVGPALAQLPKLVRESVAGLAGAPFRSDARHMVADHLLAVAPAPAQMRARWAWLPAGGQIDQSAVQATNEPSWLLDLDTFVAGPADFEATALVELARSLAERSYAMFRWAVTDDFLRNYGGAA